MAKRGLSPAQYAVLKAAVFLLLLAPALAMALRAPRAADPAEFLTGETGEFALRILLLTLAITPLQRLSGWNQLIKLRRMIGLYAFFYALLHFLTYLLLDLQLDFAGVWDDIVKRKYITVGFAAFVLLIPLAVTSNDRLLRRLGAKRWLRLHKAIYVIAPLAVLHFFWQQRGDDWSEPAVYAVITAALLALRVPAVAARIKRKR